MLVEVRCDKFISHDQVRPPIRFNLGLNVVLGDDNGSNSIGKSTFLMILDFVFGGTDYVKKCADVQKKVGDHTICFAFEFEEEMFYFSRNSIKYREIKICDENYVPIPDKQPLGVDAYCEFLNEKYHMNRDGLTWRGAVSRFIRVYRRETLDEEHPLQSAKREKPDVAIESFMKLWNRYSIVEKQIDTAQQAIEERDAFNQSQKYNHIRSARNKTEYADNKKKITRLQEQEAELAKNSNEGLLDLDSMQARRITEIQSQLVQLRRQAAQVRYDLNNVRRDMSGEKRGFKSGFSELERFFPNEDFRVLEEVESFHRRLSKVLRDEYKEAERNLAISYAVLNNEIVKLMDELADIKKIPNVSEAILKEYAAITTELNNLQTANKNYEDHEKLDKNAKDYAETRDKVIVQQLLEIQTAVNKEMRSLTRSILGEGKQPPILTLEKLNKYQFETPNDGGTGAQFRGVITFDLANLKLTPLPFIVHDSIVLKNLSKDTLAKIVKLYESVDGDPGQPKKQVFISYDSLDSYDAETGKVMKEHGALKLSPGGNELFGWAWNEETEKNEDENK